MIDYLSIEENIKLPSIIKDNKEKNIKRINDELGIKNINKNINEVSIGQSGYVTTITEGTIGDNTNANSTQNVNNVESYSNNRKGNMGNRTNAELFKVASESIVNIDQMIYNECSDLFMLLY